MEVILQENFHALGYVGDLVKVKPGYARNFLIPRGIAVEASSRNERVLKHRLSSINAKKVKLRGEATEFAKRLEGVVLEFTLKVGSGGRSFGSVSSRDIEAQLKEKGFELDKRQIRLIEPIRRAGESSVQIKLHAEVSATIPVIVRAEVSKAASNDAGSTVTKSRRSKKQAAEDGADAVDSAASDSSETQAGDEERADS
jgi:large subunit ribosomal protein L9